MTDQHLSVTLAADMVRILGMPQRQSDDELAECLLAAADLGIRTPSVELALQELVERGQRQQAADAERLIAAVRRQHVYVRYDAAPALRQAFLSHWIDERAFSGHDLVSVAALVGLAIQQLDRVAPAAQPYVRDWFARHPEIRSRRTIAWAPYYLRRVGSPERAAAVAEQLLSERDRNGSWDSTLSTSVACAYALSRYLAPDFAALAPTLAWIIGRFERGLVDANAILNTQTLKLLATTDRVPKTALASIAAQLAAPRAKVFISHNHQDKAFVRTLAADLIRHGVRPWVDEAEILPGESIVAKVSEALDTTEAVAIVLSRASVASEWVKREVNAALASMLSGRRIRLIPLVIDDCDVPTLLRDVYWVDFRADYATALKRLLSAFPEQRA
jgi:hypothetical protein